MGLCIRRSAYSQVVQRHLQAASERVNDHQRRLASGLRIARAADDPAGLGMAERMRVRARSSAAAIRNVESGLGLVRMAQDGLTAVNTLVARLQELAVTAANGTTAPFQTALLEVEWRGLTAEVKRLSTATVFNGIPVLGRSRTIRLQVGTEPGERLRVRTFNIARAGRMLNRFGLSGRRGPRRAQRVVLRVMRLISDVRGNFAATEARLLSIQRTLEQDRIHESAAQSRVRDLDYALEMADMARDLIVQAAALAVQAQANVDQELALEVLESALAGPLHEDGREDGREGRREDGHEDGHEQRNI